MTGRTDGRTRTLDRRRRIVSTVARNELFHRCFMLVQLLVYRALIITATPPPLSLFLSHPDAGPIDNWLGPCFSEANIKVV